MPIFQKVVCDYCDSAAILTFEDSGGSHYVCSNEHYHLYYERKYQNLIQIRGLHDLPAGLRVLDKIAQKPPA